MSSVPEKSKFKCKNKIKKMELKSFLTDLALNLTLTLKLIY